MLLIILCIALIFVFIAYSSSCIPAAADTLLQCLTVVIPSIFPFLVITEILVKTKLFTQIGKMSDGISNVLFKISGNALSVVFIGYLCGFPGAAKITSDLYRRGNISYADAVRLSLFTNNPGPLFMIGTVGFGFLNSVSLGIKLFLIQVVSSLLTGMILCRLIKIQEEPPILPITLEKKPENSLGIITESISSAFLTMIPITGTIVFFSFFSQAVIASDLLNSAVSFFTSNYNAEILNGCIKCFFELTSGLSALIPTLEKAKYLSAVISLACSWSGISIHMQISNFYIKEKIPVKYYFIGKLFCMIFSFLITCFVF